MTEEFAEKSGVHLTGADSGWPTASALEPPLRKVGDGVDGLPKASAVADGEITALTEVVYISLAGGDTGTGFTLTLDGQTTGTIAKTATGATVQTAVEALSNVAPAGADVTVEGAAGGPYLFKFVESGAWGDVVPAITADPVGTNEVQTLTVTGTPDGGTIKVQHPTDSEKTATIAYNANAAAVDSALEALALIPAGGVTCTGGALPGTPVVITFTGALAEANQPLLVVTDNALTGGTTPAAAIVETTPGKTGPTVTVDVVAEGS